MKCRLAIVAVALLAAAALPAGWCGAGGSAGGKRVLAVVGDAAMHASHSQLFQGLQDAGLEVEILGHKDDGLMLRRHDTALYDHLLLLAPKASGLGGELSRGSVLDFMDRGGNVVLALSAGASDLMRGLAAELGVEVDAKGTRVYDHFSRQAAGGASDATLVATSAWPALPAIVGSPGPAAPVLFRGVAQAVPTNSELVTVVLSAEASGYSHDPKKAPAEPPLLPAGGTAALVSAVQARNNARALVVGSLDMLSNEMFDAEVEVAATGKKYPKSGNRAFALATMLWAMQQRGVLEVGEPRHRTLSGTGPEESPPLYRVNDEAEFEIDIWELEGGQRRPYTADDVQLSFTMLDPHIRQPLTTSGDGVFRLRFVVPDVYGVFKYAIDYRRPGYSAVALQHVVPVRPFRHDEYERFLLPAYPYYASAVSTMAAFFLLGLTFLYGKR